MLEFIRSHQRWALALLALFILPGLGLIGIRGSGFFDDNANVASVNGHKISIQEFDAAVRDQMDSMRDSAGASFDPKMFDTPQMRAAMLDQMIQQRTVADEAQRENLTVTNEAVLKYELSLPAIAQLRKPDGTMDLDGYRSLLASQGMTPDQFDARIRYELSEQQTADNIGSSAIAPKSLAAELSSLADQQREVQSLAFHPADYAAQVHPTDDQLKAYYDAHAIDFQTPASVNVNYLSFDQGSLAAAYQPSDADIQKYYQDNQKQYTTPEQVRASHILITVAKDASAADVQKAKDKAQALLAQVRAHPDQFAAIAKQNSQDSVSADRGGDLGFFEPAGMVPEVANAAFHMKKDQISDLVRSEFGFHIVKVTDIHPGAVQPLANVKDSIVNALRQTHAAQVYADQADAFGNTVYEQASSLQPAADKFHLTIRQATLTPKGNSTLPATDPLNNPKLLAAVFADDATKAKHNTAAIDLGNNTLISAHVTQYTPAAIPPFDAVKAQVLQKLTAEQAGKLAHDAGVAKLAALQATPSTAGFGAVQKVSRSDQQVPQDALRAIFRVDSHHLPQYVGTDLGADGYVIDRVNAIDNAPPADATKAVQVQQQIAQINAQGETNAYLAALRARSKVKIYSIPKPSDADQ